VIKSFQQTLNLQQEKRVLMAQTKKIAFTCNPIKRTSSGSVYHKVLRIETQKRKKSYETAKKENPNPVNPK